MKVAVSGTMGRLGSAIAHGIARANDMNLQAPMRRVMPDKEWQE